MIFKELTRFSILTLFVGIALVISCDGESSPAPEEVSIDQLKAQITAVTDVSNNGDASDIQVEFSGGAALDAVSEYRLIAVKSDDIAMVNVDLAMALGADRYLSVGGGQTVYNRALRRNQQDADGDVIELGAAYKILVLSLGTLNDEPVAILSIASEEVSIINFAETSTLVSNLQANDGVSIDAEGNIYVSNYGAYDNSIMKGNGTRVMKVSPNGTSSVFATGMSNPVGNAVDKEGNFYVNDDNNFTSGNIVKIAPDGTKSLVAIISGYPAGMSYGADGNLYVSNYGIGVVSRVGTDGTVTEIARDDRFVGAIGITHDAVGNVIVANSITGDILSVSANGTVSVLATIPTVVSRSVIGYITFFEGNLYATGIGAQKIYKVSLAGEITVFAGSGAAVSADGELMNASFSGPNGIAVDKERRLLYISEANGGSPRLRVIPLD